MRLWGLALAVLLSARFASAKSELYTDHVIFTAHIEQVRSIAPESRVGFSKSLPLYAVDVTTAQKHYVVYCIRSAPSQGADLQAEIDHVSADYSAVHLWPEEKSSVGVPGRGRLYKVINFKNAQLGKYPDLACDVYSETGAAPK